MLIKNPQGWEIPENEATPEGTWLNRRQILLHRLPDDAEVYAHVIVNQFVSHAGHGTPRDIWY